MKRIVLLVAAVILVGLPSTAFADTFTFQAPATAPNEGSAVQSKSILIITKRIHGGSTTWISRARPSREPSLPSPTSATGTAIPICCSFTCSTRLIRAGSGHLQTPVEVLCRLTQIIDNFNGALFNSNPLVTPGTGNTFLTAQSFTTTASTFVYNFSADQLKILNTYFLNGNNAAFGLDPDCHFWNNGIKFEFTTTDTIPEPTTMVLLGSGIAGLYLKRRRRKMATQI